MKPYSENRLFYVLFCFRAFGIIIDHEKGGKSYPKELLKLVLGRKFFLFFRRVDQW